MNRRKFLKYAGTSATVVGASALGFAYLYGPRTGNQTIATSSLDRTPPVIKDFQFLPTRIVNEKIYDSTISFTVEDQESTIVDVSATLQDYNGTIPSRAYPAERSRTLQLTPSQTSAGGHDTYSATVTDLKGGREYQAILAARNSASEYVTAEFETPYVREFEDITGKDGIVVAASYHPWWYWYSWKWWEANVDTERTPSGTPLLGLYNSTDPLVVAKHIDWATGYGVDSFCCSTGVVGMPGSIDSVLQNELAEQIKVGIRYETGTLLPGQPISLVDLTIPTIYSQLESSFSFMAENYFAHPSMLRVDRRPVIHLFNSGSIRTDIVEPLKKLRQQIDDLGFEMFLVGDELNWDGKISNDRIRAFDAITSYVLPWPPDLTLANPSKVRSEYLRWQTAAHSEGVELIPCVVPGFDNSEVVSKNEAYRALGNVNPEHFKRSSELFASNLKVAIDFVDEHRLLDITSWDEWGENSVIEPTVEEGFKYLQTLRDTLAGH